MQGLECSGIAKEGQQMVQSQVAHHLNNLPAMAARRAVIHSTGSRPAAPTASSGRARTHSKPTCGQAGKHTLSVAKSSDPQLVGFKQHSARMPTNKWVLRLSSVTHRQHVRSSPRPPRLRVAGARQGCPPLRPLPPGPHPAGGERMFGTGNRVIAERWRGTHD